jgi:type I restriction enzyme, S subunit
MSVVSTRLRFFLRERDERGRVDERVLSVYRDHGVVEKDSRTDNFNKTPLDLSNYKLVKPNDVVVNKMKAWQGSVSVSSLRGIVSGDYLVCEITSPDVNPRFLHYLLRSHPMVSEYRRRSTGIRPSQWRLYWPEFGDIRVTLPSVNDQRAIAAFLDREMDDTDVLVAQSSQLVGLARERFLSAVDHSIRGADGPERTVASLGTYINGWPFKPGDLTTSGTPVIRIEQLVDSNAPMDFYEGDLPDHVRLRNGDLVFSWSSSLQVRPWHRGHAYLNQHLFRVLPAEGIDKRWLRYALDSATRLFARFMHGSTMTHITQPMMKAVRLPVPTLETQREVADYLSNVEAWMSGVTAAVNEEIELIRERRQAVISSALLRRLEAADVA